MRIRMFVPAVEEEEIEAVVRVLRSRWLVHGPEVEAFEKEFAEYIGTRYALAVSNGTVALTLILKALDIGPGDEVLVPDYTFIATATSVLMVGAKPVPVDVEWDTFNISIEDVLNKLSPRVKAIIAVHLFGHPADVKALKEIAEDRGIALIEDAAQAHGAEAYGRKVGSFGIATAFSFYATKNMTTGEGGMVTTDDRRIAERIALLRNHGQVARYVHEILGGNFRMTAIQAAIGRIQLRKLDRLNDARRRNASFLTQLLSNVEGLELPVEKSWAKHVYHLYAVKIRGIDRDCVRECMLRNGIEVGIHYPVPIHRQPLFQKLGYEECCPNAVELSKCELSLPVHPYLTKEDVEFVAQTLKQCIDRCRTQ